jgi:hypothetical protein
MRPTSVEALLRVYAKCASGQEEIANRRIAEILGTGEQVEAPGSASGAAPEN